MAKQEKADNVVASIDDIKTVTDLIHRGNDGDEAALSRIREILSGPDAALLFRTCGDMGRHAETSLIRAIVGDRRVYQESIEAKLEALKKDLAGPNPTPTERLLVDRIAACWLQLADADLIAAQTKNPTFVQGDYNQRRQDRAHRRFLSAVKMLATVRRLALPIQVDLNVAAKAGNQGGQELKPGQRIAGQSTAR